MRAWLAAERPRRALDALWLLALAVYVLAGLPLATFHGDEAMQIYTSHDYARAFIYGDPLGLMVGPPYYIDTDPWLRILNGTINRHAIGLSWHLAGFTNGDLPPAPGWDWGLDYDTNVATHHRPPDDLLWAARVSSALFLALSSAVMFGIGWGLGGRPLAYIASALYTLNPVILLNGRRAMMEGSLLLFGLLALLLAVIISRRRAAGQPAGVIWWLGLALACGSALASKHSAAVFVAAAFGWIFVADITRRRWRHLLALIPWLALSAALTLALFIALSPALWNDPPARLGDLLEVRAGLIDIQVQADPAAPMTLAERVQAALMQPFMMPVAHYEAGGWTDFAPVNAQAARYMASPLSGWQAGTVGGLLLTLLAGVGLICASVPRWRPARLAWGQYAGLLLWLLVSWLFALVNPLPWQRYYLPLIPVCVLLAGLGMRALVAAVIRRASDGQTARKHIAEGWS